MHDGDWHSFALVFSGEEGYSAIYLDGQELTRVEGLEGQSQRGALSYDLTIGNVAATTQYGGLLDKIVMLNDALDASQLADLDNVISNVTPGTPVPFFNDWESLQEGANGDSDVGEDYDVIEATDGSAAYGGHVHCRLCQ